MEEVARQEKNCDTCERLIAEDAHFCRYCGASQDEQQDIKQELETKKWLTLIAVFYGIDLVICTVVNFVPYFSGLDWLLMTDLVIGVITLLFLFFIWKDTRHLFKWENFTVPKLLVYTITSVIFAVVVNLIVRWLNKHVFDEDVYFYYSFGHLSYPRLSMILIVALLPAVFEELAYRGIILQGLLNVIDEKQAVFIAAFFFAVIHMSFISFFWLLPFAIWLGNIRWKENTIWYGVVIHFCFNATACLLEFYQLKLY